jgi:hypothetical protein
VTQLLLGSLAPPQIWNHIPVEDPRASVLYDRHYSRQTEGADGVLAPGQRFLLWHEGPRGAALWGVVRNRFRGVHRWRNAIFRNESGTLSSDLIRAATASTYDVWARRYKSLPPEALETEIDIFATAARRSRGRPPGYSYACAGWVLVRIMLAGHGRSAKAIYAARDDADPWAVFCRHWLLVGQWMFVVADQDRRRARAA